MAHADPVRAVSLTPENSGVSGFSLSCQRYVSNEETGSNYYHCCLQEGISNAMSLEAITE
jgi:hypothetical protein